MLLFQAAGRGNAVSDTLREPLFDEERMRVYPRMILGAYVIGIIAIVLVSKAMIDPFGKALGYDFITFWAASHLTLLGDPAAAFDAAKIFAAEKFAVAGNEVIYLWHYPPTYQLLTAPLALMPYMLSFVVFVGTGLIAYVLALRPLLADFGRRESTLLVLAFPGLFICAMNGQNSVFTAALFAAAILAHERGRIWLAGLALGLLAFKPQFGILVPVALIAAGQWRLIFTTGVVTIVFAGISALFLGVDLWLVFIKDAPLVRQIMEQGFLPWEKMPSAFIFFFYFGVSASIAYVFQAVTALAAAATTAYVWRKVGPSRLSWAVLVSATLLVSPYIFYYEYAVLAVPLFILASDMAARGATRNEKIALLVFYVLPFVASNIAEYTHFQIGFPMLLAALYISTKRALSTDASCVSLPTPVPL